MLDVAFCTENTENIIKQGRLVTLFPSDIPEGGSASTTALQVSQLAVHLPLRCACKASKWVERTVAMGYRLHFLPAERSNLIAEGLPAHKCGGYDPK